MNYNDELVSMAFSEQSKYFDDLDNENELTKHLRNIYRNEINKQAKPNSKILELNCGTGIDSIFFAKQNYFVLATDNSVGMLDKLDKKIGSLKLQNNIKTQRCSYTELDSLGNEKYDYIISNFGGLNCTDHLDIVLHQFKSHLSPNGKITLVIMPKISPWELIMIFKGKFKTAFRRFKKNTPAKIEGVEFLVYYYSPSYVLKNLKRDFKLITLKGIYFAVPPEFYKNFVERYPRLYKFLQKVEFKLASYFPFYFCCDHYMITMQLKSKP